MEAADISINNGSSEKNISELPNDILTRIMELLVLSPQSACRLAAVSTTFRSFAESDEIWTRFLPSDLPSILSSAEADVQQHLPIRKKELYLYLCNNWIRLDGGIKSFSLDFRSGAKKIMLHEGYFERNGNDAQIITILWTYARGIVHVKDLSTETNYAAYLVFTGTSYDENVNHDDIYYCNVTWVDVNLKIFNLKIWQESQMRDDGRWEIDTIKFKTYFGRLDLDFFFIYANYVGGGFHFEGIEIRPTD